MKVKDLIKQLKNEDPENVVMLNTYDDTTSIDTVQPADNDITSCHSKGPFYNRVLVFKGIGTFPCTVIHGSYDYEDKEKDAT